ncbi:MAG: DNRLRE domain-containing protein, partial [Prosthecobacter sp.]
LFSEDVNLARDYSDGAGYLYAGRTGPNFGPYNRRALVAFDFSGQVPYPALIQSAQLKLKLSKAGPSSSGVSFTVHRLTQTWGEGTSLNLIGGYGAPATTGDATWAYRFHNTSSWSTPGGSFTATASAAALQSGAAFMTWASTTLLKADVQAWVNAPATNAGWIIRSDETSNTTACQFSSIQSGGSPPVLDITYDAAPTDPYNTWLATYFPTNLTGQFVDPEGDNDSDGIKNQIEYAYGLNPLAFDESSDFSTAPAPAALGATDFAVTFRRDSSAVNLIYKLQTSSDLLLWTTVAQSTAGAVTVPQTGDVSVSESAHTGTINLVTVTQTLPAGSNDKKFVRLQVDRF